MNILFKNKKISFYSDSYKIESMRDVDSVLIKIENTSYEVIDHVHLGFRLIISNDYKSFKDIPLYEGSVHLLHEQISFTDYKSDNRLFEVLNKRLKNLKLYSFKREGSAIEVYIERDI